MPSSAVATLQGAEETEGAKWRRLCVVLEERGPVRSLTLPRTRHGSTENGSVLDTVKVLGTHRGLVPCCHRSELPQVRRLEAPPAYSLTVWRSGVQHGSVGLKPGWLPVPARTHLSSRPPPPAAHAAALHVSGPSSTATSFSLAEARRVLCF